MYVCVCLGVTEHEVAAAVAGGAHHREAVTRACRAGGDCGACHTMIESMIEDHLDATRARPSCGGAAPCEVGVEAAASGPSLVSAERIVRTRAA